jgi:hypothetical protein
MKMNLVLLFYDTRSSKWGQNPKLWIYLRVSFLRFTIKFVVCIFQVDKNNVSPNKPMIKGVKRSQRRNYFWGRRGRDLMVVGFTTTYAIRVRCTTLWDKVCQWLATGRWFAPPIKLTGHDVRPILKNVSFPFCDPTLKVVGR